MKTEHTPEPWFWNEKYGEVCFRSKEDDQSYGMACPVDLTEEANARRIVACVNACEDILDYELSLGCVARLSEQLRTITKLRETIAAQAAVIERLTKRLASTNIIIEVVCAIHPDFACAKYELAENMNTLAIPTDSTQILDEVRRAEREKCADVCEKSDRYRGDYFAAKIRAMGDE